jgi:hypothetical protein
MIEIAHRSFDATYAIATITATTIATIISARRSVASFHFMVILESCNRIHLIGSGHMDNTSRAFEANARGCGACATIDGCR